MDSTDVPVDMLRRAEMFNFIADIVRSWPAELGPQRGQSSLYQSPSSGVTSLPGQTVLPRVVVIGTRVACGAASFDLRSRPLMLRLFRMFCDAIDQQLSRDEILRHVYFIHDLEHRSERYLEAKYCNSVKLISRARMLATESFSPLWKHHIEWFVYDQERKVWCLYRMRNEYFLERSVDTLATSH